jgi:hypothetical protein
MTIANNLINIFNKFVVSNERINKSVSVYLIACALKFYYQTFFFHAAKVVNFEVNIQNILTDKINIKNNAINISNLKNKMKIIEKNMINYLVNRIRPIIFAPELMTVQPSYSVFIIAALFFITACNQNSIGLLNSSGSRYLALLTVAKVRVQQSFFIYNNLFLIRQMQRSVKNASDVNKSSIQARVTHEKRSETEKPKSVKSVKASKKGKVQKANIAPVQTQIIHQYVIPTNPQGLIGEKVVYSNKFINKMKQHGGVHVPLPECGYFTIVKAVLSAMRGYGTGVMVALSPYDKGTFRDGTHISLGNMKKYEPQELLTSNTTKS